MDKSGVTRRLPKIRHLILGACPNEGTVHSWRPWHADFQDVLNGFIPTLKIEGRIAAFAFAQILAGGMIAGPDYLISAADILALNNQGLLEADSVGFYRLYVPMRQQLMPTNDFLTPVGAGAATNVNNDSELRSQVLLDLNAVSTPGNNPWVDRVGTAAGEGGVIPTFASGARVNMSPADFIIPGLILTNDFISTAAGITQLGSGQGVFLPLLDLLKPSPIPVSTAQSRFPRIGDNEPAQELSGDGNAFFSSYLSTFANDSKIMLVQWGNGPLPPNLPPNVAWSRFTDFPVYHDVFFYNPGVRAFVVQTLTGTLPPFEPAINPDEVPAFQKFLDGREGTE